MRRLIPWVFILLVLFVSSARILGAFVAPVLERKLSNLFGMPVSIEHMDINLLTGQVYAENLEFRNQSGFSYSPHLHAASLQFDINFWKLRDKQVKIGTLILRDLYYLIERTERGGEKITNITTWIRHIKSRRKADSGPGEWQVLIENILIQQGTFIYEDRSDYDHENRFVFHHLNGSLREFEWPAENPTHLQQKVELGGYMGEEFPAPFFIEGHANFATSSVSFDLEGRATGGQMVSYERFWRGLPIELKSGKFDLHIRMICVRKMVKSRSLLRLYDLKIIPGRGITDMLWGIPVTTALGFLQKQQEFTLHVPVSGNIKDPKFEFDDAFFKAFQEAFRERLYRGVMLFARGPVRLAEKTGAVVAQTQETLSSSIGKITAIIVKKEPAGDA